jgi:Flp pilus assembly protein TadG
MIFGLALIPILGLSGGAVDLAHRSDVRVQVQTAADSAALAAARVVQTGQLSTEERWRTTRAEARKAARNVLRSGLVGVADIADRDLDIQIRKTGVQIAANVDVPTSFLKIIGIDGLAADAYSEVQLPDPIQVEIAMVLDYSGSMAENDKYVRMTDAATDFIDKIAVERGERTKIAIVPFSDYVYAAVPAGHIRGTRSSEARQMRTACLINRDYPYAATDERPRNGVDGSRWPQADPGNAKCQAYAAGNLQVRDLSNDFVGLSSALESMRPTNLTNISLATEMGFHVLSPGAPFETARDFNEKNLEKVLILLTDGMQTMDAMGPGGAVSTEAADEVTAETCDNMADSRIRVFTIAYDIEEERVRDLLSGCASAAENYHEATGAADISGVFEAIYQQIAESVWLSK